MTEEIEVSRRTGLVILCFICFLAGIFTCFIYITYDPNLESRVDYVEHMLKNPYWLPGSSGQGEADKALNMSLLLFKDIYFGYNPISRGMLQYELEKICQMKPEELENRNFSGYTECISICDQWVGKKRYEVRI